MVYLSPTTSLKRETYTSISLVYLDSIKRYIILAYELMVIALVKCPICKVGNIPTNSELGLCSMWDTTVKEYIMAIYELAGDKNRGAPIEEVESLVNKKLKQKFRSRT